MGGSCLMHADQALLEEEAVTGGEAQQHDGKP